MDKGNMTSLSWNVSATGRNASNSPETITSTNLITFFLILAASLVGIAVNVLCLWVLGKKMQRTVNTLWFLHLTLAYLIYCSLVPFFAVYILLDFSWVFGSFMCKLIITSFSLGMFTTVFLLTIISLDRYLFTCHPTWSKHNRTVRRAQRLVTGVWLVSLVLSAPYLAFQKTHKENGHIKCSNHFYFSGDSDGTKMQAPLDAAVNLTFFVIRFLLAFVIPFFIIMACYCWVGQEIKKKDLVRRIGKPFRVLVAAVTSFFICWLPYHIYYASLLIEGVSETTVNILWVIMVTGACFNICFTPILYLFVGEKFQQVFKMSILTVLKKGFMDIPITPGNNNRSSSGEGY